MKKTFLILSIPLVFLMQEVFAASFNQNSYNVPSPTTGLMRNNIPDLQENTKFYNSNIQNELNNIQRNPVENNNYQFMQDELSPFVDMAPNAQNYTTMPIEQHQKPRKLENFIQREQETPKWWRQENSYQGWGFD